MKKYRSSKAQAMVEFALALPILLLVIYGLLEAGRVIYLYAAVNTASREATRFGSAWGIDDAGIPRYKDCAAIRDAAKNVGILLNLQDSNIIIQYDHGPDVSGPTIPNCTAISGPGAGINVSTGDRVSVTVTYNYTPILPLVPLTAKTISSSTSRTIMGEISLNP